MKLYPNKIYQFVFDYGYGIRKTTIPKFKGACRTAYKNLTKRLAIKRDDTVLIELKIGKSQLLFNATHSFPGKHIERPLYATNLSRLCGFLESRLGPINVVDVGANVGDTAALIASCSSASILCIEGNSEYHELLCHNASKIAGAETEFSYVGERDECRAAVALSDGIGTTTLVYSQLTQTCTQLKFRTLDSIIFSHPKFKRFKLLKIDTDGHDLPIICANFRIIKESRAVIHMEYAPSWMPEGKDSQIQYLKILSQFGYNNCIVYTSEGELYLEGRLDTRETVRSFHEYLSRGKRYGDIAVFSDEDSEIFQDFVESEYRHMQTQIT